MKPACVTLFRVFMQEIYVETFRSRFFLLKSFIHLCWDHYLSRKYVLLILNLNTQNKLQYFKRIISSIYRKILISSLFYLICGRKHSQRAVYFVRCQKQNYAVENDVVVEFNLNKFNLWNDHWNKNKSREWCRLLNWAVNM